jgi:hypothetical protein
MEPTLSWRISVAVLADTAEAPAGDDARATTIAGRTRVRRRITLHKYVKRVEKEYRVNKATSVTFSSHTMSYLRKRGRYG